MMAEPLIPGLRSNRCMAAFAAALKKGPSALTHVRQTGRAALFAPPGTNFAAACAAVQQGPQAYNLLSASLASK